MRNALLSVALVSASCLLAETTLIRLLAVALWYPIAYVVLSLAMLGLAMGAVVVLLSSRLAASAPDSVLRRAAAVMGLSIAVGYPLWATLTIAPTHLLSSPGQCLAFAALLFLLGLPFLGAGVFVAKAFAMFSDRAARLYAADLTGAALGVVVYVLVIGALGGPGTLALAAGLAALAAVALLDPGWRRGSAVVATAVVTILLATSLERLFPLHVSPDKLGTANGTATLPRDTRWSPSSAVSVFPVHAGWYLAIDGGAAWSLAPRRVGKLPPPEALDLRSLVYRLAPPGNSAVIGSGGGLEVAAAVDAGVGRVLALEVDPTICALVTTKLAPGLGRLFADPRVQLVNAEARAYLSSHNERFDSIVSFHTISNAALSTGGLGLVENYLLTTEAMQLLLARLTTRGLLAVSRPEPQIPRLVAMLRAASSDVQTLSKRLAIVADGSSAPAFLSVVLVKATPFEKREVELLASSGARVLYLPDGGGDRFAFFAQILGGMAPFAESPSAGAPSDAALRPATDDRPFFNLRHAWSELRVGDLRLLSADPETLRWRMEDAPVVQLAVGFLLFCILLLAGVVVGGTAWRIRRRQAATAAALWSVGTYYGLLGYSFMATELVVVQSLTRLVGSPNLSLLVVLAALLAGTGVGSLALAGRLRVRPSVATTVAAFGALFVAVAIPVLVNGASPGEPWQRSSLAVALAASVGACLGSPFAAGLRRLRGPELVAWAWAVNCLLTVLAAAANIISASSFGLRVTALTAAVGYLLAALTAGRGRLFVADHSGIRPGPTIALRHGMP